MSTIEERIEVRVPVRVAYDQWTQFEEFPRFMEGVEEVRQLDDAHLHWRASVGGKTHEWDAEITQQVPDQTISWTATEGYRNAGTVSFQALDADRTEIRLTLDHEPEGAVEKMGDWLGMAQRRARGDLERFREMVESRGAPTGEWRGEIHGGQTTGGMSSGAGGMSGATGMSSASIAAGTSGMTDRPMGNERDTMMGADRTESMGRDAGLGRGDDTSDGPTPETRSAGLGGDMGAGRRMGDDLTEGPTPETRAADRMSDTGMGTGMGTGMSSGTTTGTSTGMGDDMSMGNDDDRSLKDRVLGDRDRDDRAYGDRDLGDRAEADRRGHTDLTEGPTPETRHADHDHHGAGRLSGDTPEARGEDDLTDGPTPETRDAVRDTTDRDMGRGDRLDR